MTNRDGVDVLVVGAGPTGLALAAQLQRCGTTFRIVDRAAAGVGESRALAVLPRTLEVLATLGLADVMVEHGNPTVRLEMHSGTRTTRVPLFDIGLADTAFPFLLFLSQAETEAILERHLADHGVTVERGVELVGLEPGTDRVLCTMGDGGQIVARYVVGCDGANSTVRGLAGIDFIGSPYPQTFVLADLDAAGLGPDAAHVFLSRAGMLFFFPLGRPAPWRLLAIDPTSGGRQPQLPDLQELVDAYTKNVDLTEPVWTSVFGLQQRRADRYRAGRVFLAGDAAHVHSPAGAQGMNTGIQDAWNLGWKLALVANSTASTELLDTYQHEREPIGRDVVRFTDRAFRIATSRNRLIGGLRTHLAPRLLHALSRSRRARAAGFRVLSQLAVTYKDSPAVRDDRPRSRRPRAGDRVPDAPVALDGHPRTLHEILAPARFHLLTTGDAPNLDHDHIDVHQLTSRSRRGALVDADGQAHQRLGLDPATGGTVLVRPDGHIAYRCDGTDLTGLHHYLSRWLS